MTEPAENEEITASVPRIQIGFRPYCDGPDVFCQLAVIPLQMRALEELSQRITDAHEFRRRHVFCDEHRYTVRLSNTPKWYAPDPLIEQAEWFAPLRDLQAHYAIVPRDWPFSTRFDSAVDTMIISAKTDLAACYVSWAARRAEDDIGMVTPGLRQQDIRDIIINFTMGNY